MKDLIPTIEKTTTVRKSPYIRPQSVKDLQDLHTDWKYRGRNIPYRVKSSFRDDTANGLAKCIKAWCEINGAHFQRMNTTGLYDHKLKKYRRSGATRGVTDTLVIWKGKTFNIEIKIGRDKQSDQQKEIQKSIEEAGGFYLIVKSFDDFLKQVEAF